MDSDSQQIQITWLLRMYMKTILLQNLSFASEKYMGDSNRLIFKVPCELYFFPSSYEHASPHCLEYYSFPSKLLLLL